MDERRCETRCTSSGTISVGTRTCIDRDLHGASNCISVATNASIMEVQKLAGSASVSFQIAGNAGEAAIAAVIRDALASSLRVAPLEVTALSVVRRIRRLGARRLQVAEFALEYEVVAPADEMDTFPEAASTLGSAGGGFLRALESSHLVVPGTAAAEVISAPVIFTDQVARNGDGSIIIRTDASGVVTASSADTAHLVGTRTDLSGTCTDIDWVSEGNSTCEMYFENDWCNPQGGPSHGWNSHWGALGDWADDEGVSAADACCRCGGGTSVTTLPPEALPEAPLPGAGWCQASMREVDTLTFVAYVQATSRITDAVRRGAAKSFARASGVDPACVSELPRRRLGGGRLLQNPQRTLQDAYNVSFPLTIVAPPSADADAMAMSLRNTPNADLVDLAQRHVDQEHVGLGRSPPPVV